MPGLWLVVSVGVAVLTGSCVNSEDGGNEPVDCLQWQIEACEAYHACGMMRGVESCSQNASEQCPEEELLLNTSKTCNALTMGQLEACISKIETLCPTFEELYEIPACVEFVECVGWPM